MARDTQAYDYYTVGIPRNTRIHDLMMEDAKDSGRLKEISSLLSVRIADFYLQRNGLIQGGASVVPTPQEPEVKQPPANAKSNALASMDEW